MGEEGSKKTTSSPSSSSSWSSIKEWFAYYFLEGQAIQDKAALSPDSPWYERHRQLLAFAIPPLLIHTVYWAFMISHDKLGVFKAMSKATDIPNWYLAVTMIFGGFIGGSTSEGGAAVSFPVLTLAFRVKPKIARDVAFMGQSFGMTSATFTILVMRIKVDWYSIIYTTMGGLPGILVGINYVFPMLPPPYPKMVFVSTWLAFGFALYLVNRIRGRKTYDTVPYWDRGVFFRLGPITFNWKAMTLITVGFVGGIASAIGGSGLDICSFAALTLLFRVSEKIATPTSIVLMAINTLTAFLYREYYQQNISQAAWDFTMVIIPVVSIFCPLGAFVSSYFHRLVHATVVYIMDIAQFLGACLLVKPWSHYKTNNPTKLSSTMAIIILVGALVFQTLTCLGERLLRIQEKWEAEEGDINKVKGMEENLSEHKTEPKDPVQA